MIPRPIVRALKPEEWSAFKNMRLMALREDSRFFSTDAKKERARFNLAWKELCRPTNDQCMFGLFIGKELAGVAMITKSPDGLLFGGTWMKKQYRNVHHANLLYAARVKWLADNPRHNHALVFHRTGNVKSQHLNRKHGGQETGRKLMSWADGTKEYGHWYRIKPPTRALASTLPKLQVEQLAAA
jgi:hypothetical protein